MAIAAEAPLAEGQLRRLKSKLKKVNIAEISIQNMKAGGFQNNMEKFESF